jgi:hypothetical protein
MMVVPLGLLLAVGCELSEPLVLLQRPTPEVPGELVSPTPCNRVVLDPVNDRAYLANRNGGIDAVSLPDGHTLWSSSLAQRPLLVCREGVICLCGGKTEMSVALLNTNTGSPIWVSEPIGVPAGTVFWEDAGSRFLCEAVLEKAVLTCAWRLEQWHVGGCQGPPGVWGREGLTRVDFRTGRILARGDQAHNTHALVPPGGKDERHDKALEFKGDRGEGPQQATYLGKRAYGVAQDSTWAERPAIGEVECLRFLESWDRITGKRLWRYPVLGKALYPSLALLP